MRVLHPLDELEGPGAGAPGVALQLAATLVVADKVDAIIVGPADGDMGAAISKVATDANIPLVYVNNVPANLSELPPKQALVASNEKDSGTLETKEVCRLLKGKGNVAVMMGELQSS